MSTPQTLQEETRQAGISAPLSEHIALLGDMLGEALREQAGPDVFDLVIELRRLCRDAEPDRIASAFAEVAHRIRPLDLETITWLLRGYTALFHLINKAEQQEIIRINRERALHSNPDAPRPESIAEAIHTLKQQGASLDDVLALLRRLDIQPTLTAHPTEARRRSILFKQQRIAALLHTLRYGKPTPEEAERILAETRNQIRLLLATDEVRPERLHVEDEVEHGLYFVRHTIWHTIPRIYRDVQQALAQYYEAHVDFPVFLRYRSWIGSDRDGNPNVTPAVTRHTLLVQRRTALELYLTALRDLRRELSVSDQQVPVPDALRASIEADAAAISLDPIRLRQYQHEPFRLKLSYLIARLERLRARLDAPAASSPAEAYTSTDFIADLRLIRQCLDACGLGEVAHSGPLSDLLVQAQTFGFHMMALDVRQHSRVHEEVVTTLLRLAGVTDDYAALPEAERQRVLSAELANPRPLVPRGTDLPDPARSVMDTLTVIREAVAHEPLSIGSYIISMTHEVSDLLEVMLLAKEAGIWRMDGDTVHCPIDFVPLFETIEDLGEADAFMERLFTHPIYRRHLAARGQFQEMMLGYSDSNKDGGYWMANWALHQAQDRLGRVCRRHGIDFRLFHGRGGTVGRGGGRANQAILSMPSACQSGRIRFTEQGEVISFRYALSDIARRHVEQIVNAMIRATSRPYDGDEAVPVAEGAPEHALMDRIADRSMAAYRRLIEDPRFWPWYTKATPIEHISRLPIASRPVSRKTGGEVDFESLRAIPWVFAWTQTRYNVPGWFGIGEALQALIDGEPGTLDQLRAMYRSWHFFRAVVNNAQREMARARLPIASRYARLADANGHASPIHDLIAADFERARNALLRITEQEHLLDINPVIQKSITLRNPYTDVLNLLQMELLHRYRQASEQERPSLRRALFLSINGIAAAMQSTG
ncbi:phosphoenolpyruvate carboxylase [Rhodothermaceae bacterium RA]|nr:phosphoenolpyruvate carboxylase [Rhodothermaceae bacterium RA]